MRWATLQWFWEIIANPIQQAFDLVMDQEAKTRWQRAKPPGKVIPLPGYLVGGEYIGVSPLPIPIFLSQAR